MSRPRVRWLGRGAFLSALVGATMLAGAGRASAHPLGNFTLNYYEGLTLSAHSVEVAVVVDSAELPTYNRVQPAVDGDHNGRLSDSERAAYADSQCARLAKGFVLTVDGGNTTMTAVASAFALLPSPTLRGLFTGRLTCELSAPAALTRAAQVSFSDHVDATYGWHEITAAGRDVHITSSIVDGARRAVAATSVSDELRHYPGGLLSTPLSVRSVNLQVAPGTGPVVAGRYSVSRPNALTSALQPLANAFERTAGSRDLTLPVAALAIALSVLLGAGHAVLPGHGKTVMAAYLVGRRGTFRDALVVGTTVTFSHTVGVLVLGLAIALSAAWVDTTTLQYLGIVSGALIASVGVGLLRSTLRGRSSTAHHQHAHPHEHDHPHGHEHAHGHDHAHENGFSRRGLIGLGIAGGLVPSPSALVVLLSAIALGRTAFGVVLVLGYGVGMAATLMGAGLALSRAGNTAGGWLRGRVAERYLRAVPFLTSALVIVVGCVLAARSAAVV
ncbi:MAG: nickel/cobalt transporter [Actinomycetes bacterium]